MHGRLERWDEAKRAVDEALSGCLLWTPLPISARRRCPGTPQSCAIPAIEAIHPEGPDPGGSVGDDNQPVCIADINPECTVHDATVVVHESCRSSPLSVGFLDPSDEKHLQPVEVSGHEDVRPADLVVMGQVLPVGRPSGDRLAD